jgi:hypothetical protein
MLVSNQIMLFAIVLIVTTAFAGGCYNASEFTSRMMMRVIFCFGVNIAASLELITAQCSSELGKSARTLVQAATRKIFDTADGGSEQRNFPNLGFLQELVRRCEMDAAEGSRGVPFHGYNAAAAVKAPRQATKTRVLGV